MPKMWPLHMYCTGSGWDGVNFFSHQTIWCHVFDWWSRMYCQHTRILLIAELCLYSFSLFLTVLSHRIGKRWREDTVGTAHPSWPKGYSIPRNIMLSNKMEREFFPKYPLLGECLGIGLLVMSDCDCFIASLLFFFFLSFFPFFPFTY